MKPAIAARLLPLLLLASGAVHAQRAVDPARINQIADEGYNHGQVVSLAAYLTDQIGSRLTNSPGMRKAEAWTQQQFKSWGLQNVHAEGFEFGRGWSIESARTRMVAPRPLDLRTIPVAWTPATNGPVTAPILVAPIRHLRDLAKWKGQAKGKIVLITYPDAPKDTDDGSLKRLSAEELSKLSTYDQPSHLPDDNRDKVKEWFGLGPEIDRFFAAEGAVAMVKMSYRGQGLLHGEGYAHLTGQTPQLPVVEMAQEDYRRLARLAKMGEVKLEIDSRVQFDDRDTKGYNILADIPGSDPKAGYVMAGAHLDSWVAGDGAVDNGAGSAVVMEAARILAALKVKPKRTIRFALWSGEEQGLYGSVAYVERHLAKRPPETDPGLAKFPFMNDNYPITPLPGFNDMAGYFNIDNGSGKIRGIFAEGNFAAIPQLRAWLEPFDSLGANRVVAKKTGGTDHEIMAAIGLPAFQFIQDPLDYSSKTHHSSIDTFDHLRTEDLRQAAVILATVLLQAAEADKPLPRNVLPRQPNQTDPFHYRDPKKD
ncbi:MAG TPA: M20/M25/M40 family metallo-hydrolase [Burkholderiaceae bacterium]